MSDLNEFNANIQHGHLVSLTAQSYWALLPAECVFCWQQLLKKHGVTAVWVAHNQSTSGKVSFPIHVSRTASEEGKVAKWGRGQNSGKGVGDAVGWGGPSSDDVPNFISPSSSPPTPISIQICASNTADSGPRRSIAGFKSPFPSDATCSFPTPHPCGLFWDALVS